MNQENQEPKTKLNVHVKRTLNHFYKPPPTARLNPGQLATPIWNHATAYAPGHPPSVRWWPEGRRQIRALITVMNDRSNILAQIEELKYAAECLEDLINNWEKKTIALGD
ncbi:hypothetical protein LCGC14_0444030 [marine sediment metagenome]|uniref:Uncharacterized protein n=1 Tax=marine sediment metagenome TaxID=412755 RepID=A0A0F9SQ92_9ZZZZ